MDGFITNSSSYSSVIIIAALRKGVKLKKMLEKIGLPPDYASFFHEKRFSAEELIKRYIENGYLDANIYDLQNDYDILTAHTVNIALTFGGDREDDIYYSDFHEKFYDELTRNRDFPKKLVGDDFILLHSIDDYSEEDSEIFKQKVMNFIEELKGTLKSKE